jgi:hypothetical protein
MHNESLKKIRSTPSLNVQPQGLLKPNKSKEGSASKIGSQSSMNSVPTNLHPSTSMSTSSSQSASLMVLHAIDSSVTHSNTTHSNTFASNSAIRIPIDSSSSEAQRHMSFPLSDDVKFQHQSNAPSQTDVDAKKHSYTSASGVHVKSKIQTSKRLVHSRSMATIEATLRNPGNGQKKAQLPLNDALRNHFSALSIEHLQTPMLALPGIGQRSKALTDELSSQVLSQKMSRSNSRQSLLQLSRSNSRGSLLSKSDSRGSLNKSNVSLSGIRNEGSSNDSHSPVNKEWTNRSKGDVSDDNQNVPADFYHMPSMYDTTFLLQ